LVLGNVALTRAGSEPFRAEALAECGDLAGALSTSAFGASPDREHDRILVELLQLSFTPRFSGVILRRLG
jgi:hypothetical protein